MSDWTTESLGDRTINLDRIRVPVRGSDRKIGLYPYYGASGIVDYVDDFLFDGLHLLVAEDGENLRSRKSPVAFLADGQFWVNNHAHVLLGNEDNDTRFLAYAVEATDISGYITGSAQPKLNQGALSSIRITAPNLPEQRGIAATLGALDDKIESNRRAGEAAASLLDAIAAEVASALPRVRLGDFVEREKETANPVTLGTERVDHYSLPAFDQGGRPDHVPASEIMSNKLVVPGRSILVSRLNPRINRTWWATPTTGVLALASTEFLCIRMQSDDDLAAVWLAVRTEEFLTELPQRVTGTSGSHQRVGPEDVLDIPVPDMSRTPPETKHAALALLERREQLNTQSAGLAALRDALLPELLSGRIRVPEAEEAVAEVVA